MKYPEKLHLNIGRKQRSSFPNKKGLSKILSYYLKINTLRISRKKNDCRSGIDYKISNAQIYEDEVELTLTRK